MTKAERRRLLRSGQSRLEMTFLGAAGGVTGSAILFEYFDGKDDTNILVDYGLHQGRGATNLNRQGLPGDLKFSDIGFIIASHQHLDHIGLVPYAAKHGFRGAVYTHHASVDMAKVLLPDSGHLQEKEARKANKRREASEGDGGGEQPKRARNPERPQEARPLYTKVDALECLHQLVGVDYGQLVQLTDDIRIKFTDAGHILGAGMVWLEFGKGSRKKTVLYTGNYGHGNSPVLCGVQPVDAADYVITESTYGDREHRKFSHPYDLGRDLLPAIERARHIDAIGGAGRIVIPAFTVDRTQTLLHELRQLMEEGVIPNIPVYLDSPMGIDVTHIYHKYPHLFNSRTQELLKKGVDIFCPPSYHETKEVDESKQLLATPFQQPIIVLGGSGMAEGGRIVNHLKQQLPRPQSSVFMVGFQAPGTLGERLLRKNEREVTFWDYELKATVKVKLKAPVKMLPYYSGHADRKDILTFLQKLPRRPKKIFAVHGEPEALSSLAQYLKHHLGREITIPAPRESFVLE